MDKILRRVRMVEGQVARRAKRKAEQKYRLEKRANNKAIARVSREAGRSLNTAIKTRHEDLELGALAPRRDLSTVNRDNNPWGSISSTRVMMNELKVIDRFREERAAWAGGAQYLCLAPGDRVVVVEGPGKGKIGPIAKLNKENMTIQLKDDFMTNTTIPEHMRNKDINPVEAIPAAIPISAVRLVHPVQDNKTDTIRDMLIKELRPCRISHDRPSRSVSFARYVPGLNITIPWPAVPPQPREEYPGDTIRMDVEERTFIPTLLRPPMPETLIDELRNGYSKFRTRHTPEYIAKIAAEEEAKRAAKGKGGKKHPVAKEMLMPVDEYNRKMREERQARGQPVLSDEMLEKIGRIIEKNRNAAVAAAAAVEKLDGTEGLAKAVKQLALGGDEVVGGGAEPPKVDA